MKTLLYIGRFQPFHNGHKLLVDDAFKHCDKLIVGLGSANARPSPKNPFSLSEREEMIKTSLDRYVHVIHLYDYPGEDNYWAKQVHNEMRKYEEDWGLYGYSKDTSSFYLNIFPGHELTTYSGTVLKIDATSIRSQFFRPDADMKAIAPYVPRGTYEVLNRIKQTDRWTVACQGAYL